MALRDSLATHIDKFSRPALTEIGNHNLVRTTRSTNIAIARCWIQHH
jgi:hypothetical protein